MLMLVGMLLVTRAVGPPWSSGSRSGMVTSSAAVCEV